MRDLEMEFRTDFEHNKDEALEQFYEHCERVAMPIEHLINASDNVVSMENIDAVHDAIQKIKDLSEYDYIGERFNKFKEEYPETFSYNFKRQAVDFLNDNLGYVWENKK